MTVHDHGHEHDQEQPPLRVTALVPTHPHGFGDHEFEYESADDLFCCVRCGGYEIALRDRVTGHISPCPGTRQDD